MLAIGLSEEISFQDALAQTQAVDRDILLGNGFSIAAHSGFNYARLLDRASVSDDVRGLFAAARTSNFEAVMRILLAEAFEQGERGAHIAREKVDALKTALIHSIHEVHPPRRTYIGAERWESCEIFLENFIGRKRRGRIFTTNYDLLLCWAVAPDRDRIKPEKRFRAYEGFRGTYYDGSCGAANIIYLHGALHLYTASSQERQLQYFNSGVPLHDQIASLLRGGGLPIVVTEGSSNLKVPRGKGFLKHAHAAFGGACRGGLKTALFTLGHGLGPEDNHILDRIPEGTVGSIYLGAYGRQEMDAFRLIADGWIARRSAAGKPPLKAYVFDSTGVVWGA
jgi:hypothetical protein